MLVITIIVNDTAIRLGGVEHAIPKSFLTNNSTFISALKGHFSNELYNYTADERKVALCPLHCADCVYCERMEPFLVKFSKLLYLEIYLMKINTLAPMAYIKKNTSQGAGGFQIFQKSFI